MYNLSRRYINLFTETVNVPPVLHSQSTHVCLFVRQWYYETIETGSVPTVINGRVFVHDEKTAPVFLRFGAQVLKPFVLHVRVDVIVVRVLQVEIVLSEQDYEVGVVANQLFGYLTVRLAQVDSVYTAMTSHSKVLEYVVLFFARYIVEHHNGSGVDLVGRWCLFVFTVRMITQSVVSELRHQSFQHPVFGLTVILKTRTCLRNVPRSCLLYTSRCV